MKICPTTASSAIYEQLRSLPGRHVIISQRNIGCEAPFLNFSQEPEEVEIQMTPHFEPYYRSLKPVPSGY